MTYDIDVGYQVESDNVCLTVDIGNGQEGGSVVCLDGVVLPTGEVQNLKVGSGRDLNGKTLTIETVVTDTLTETNKTSVTWILTGGTQRLEKTRSKGVTNVGASEIYRARFTFVR